MARACGWVILALISGCDGGFVAAPHRPMSQIPLAPGGRTMSAPTLVTLLATNDTSTATDSAANLQAFSGVFPLSEVWQAVSAEYGVGALGSAATLTGPAMSGSYTKPQLTSYVAGVLAAQSGPAPDGNTIYLLYLPDGATLGPEFGGSCGYHLNYPSDANNQGDAIAVVRRCTPASPEESQLGQLTSVASHEIVEAATNPGGHGYNLYSRLQAGASDIWAVWNGGTIELGDPCEGTRMLQTFPGGPDGGWQLQRMWSNRAAARGGDPCMPKARGPYFSVSITQDWYAAQAGGTVTIPLTGWSSGLVANWFLNRGVLFADSSGVFAGGDNLAVLSSQLGVLTAASCGKRYAINNGKTATLEVTIPGGAKSGDYLVLMVTSFLEETDTCNPLISGDQTHFWPVGIYLP